MPLLRPEWHGRSLIGGGLLAGLMLFSSSCTVTTSVTDFDNDGSSDQDDCAPADPMIYPGAEDPYGDELDSNCDGVDGNSVDQDDDGYSNAIDCDDRNANVHPGAEDPIGDQLDSNCDGIDGTAVDLDDDGFSSAVDCNDDDASIYPGAEELPDNNVDDNCDGQIDENNSMGDDDDTVSLCGNGIVELGEACDDGNEEPFDGCLLCQQEIDADGDGWYQGQDCNDEDPSIKPGAEELCDSLDRNCDGDAQQGAVDAGTRYRDGDQDGFGDPNAAVLACASSDSVLDSSDCNDSNETVHPSATEQCDGIDNDCDELIDDADPSLSTSFTVRWFVDNDLDGFGSAGNHLDACQPPGVGYQLSDTDCDDDNPARSPGLIEICDQIDNDCDQLTDDDDPSLSLIGAVTTYADMDNDTYGDPSSGTITACTPPVGFVSNDQDCDDSNGSVNPGATEVCDGLDNNCDSVVDPETTVGAVPWYRDADGDGYGKADVSLLACSQPTGYVSDDSDCDDLNPVRYPRTAFQQDNICDGLSTYCGAGLTPDELDDDGDGYIGCSPLASSVVAPGIIGGGDCDDGPGANWHNGTTNGLNRHPGAPELCDYIDNDCDDVVDEGCE